MAEAAFYLYWCALFLFFGGLFGFLLRVRRRWLILGFVLLLLPFWIPVGESFVERAAVAAEILGYIASWAAGVFAGRRLHVQWSAGRPSRDGLR